MLVDHLQVGLVVEEEEGVAGEEAAGVEQGAEAVEGVGEGVPVEEGREGDRGRGQHGLSGGACILLTRFENWGRGWRGPFWLAQVSW